MWIETIRRPYCAVLYQWVESEKKKTYQNRFLLIPSAPSPCNCFCFDFFGCCAPVLSAALFKSSVRKKKKTQNKTKRKRESTSGRAPSISEVRRSSTKCRTLSSEISHAFYPLQIKNTKKLQLAGGVGLEISINRGGRPVCVLRGKTQGEKDAADDSFLLTGSFLWTHSNDWRQLRWRNQYCETFSTSLPVSRLDFGSSTANCQLTISIFNNVVLFPFVAVCLSFNLCRFFNDFADVCIINASKNDLTVLGYLKCSEPCSNERNT